MMDVKPKIIWVYSEKEALEKLNKFANLLVQLRARLNKGFMRLDESQINDMVRMIDKTIGGK